MKKNFLYFAMGATAIFLVWLIYRQEIKNIFGNVNGKKGGDDNGEGQPSQGNSGGGSSSSSGQGSQCGGDCVEDRNRVVGKGDIGCEVERIQRGLNEYVSKKSLPLTPLVEDGVFGSLTESRLNSITGQNTIDIATLYTFILGTTGTLPSF